MNLHHLIKKILIIIGVLLVSIFIRQCVIFKNPHSEHVKDEIIDGVKEVLIEEIAL